MKKVNVVVRLLTVVLMVISLTACVGKSTNNEYQYDYDTSDSFSGSSPGEAALGAPAKDKLAYDENQETVDFDANGAIRNASTVNNVSLQENSMEKIIRQVYMDVETQDFDELIDDINNEISSLGGYVESSDISGKRYYNVNVLRSANIIARIPKDQLDSFVGMVYETSNVVKKSETTKNVTLEYVDTESRKKSLEIEQERLFELLEKTDTLEEIITLETRLSTIRYELQSYESQLRIYDNQVEYSTVTLSVEEVERMTPKEEEKVTVMSRIKNGLSDTMYNISEGFKDFIVGFTVNLPYIVFWAAIIVIGILLTRRYYRKHWKSSLQPPEKPKNDDGDQDK